MHHCLTMTDWDIRFIHVYILLNILLIVAEKRYSIDLVHAIVAYNMSKLNIITSVVIITEYYGNNNNIMFRVIWQKYIIILINTILSYNIRQIIS